MGIIKEAAKDAFNKSFGTIHISFKWVNDDLRWNYDTLEKFWDWCERDAK